MHFNNKILSIFARNNRFGSDMQSTRLRYQAICNIYINFSFALAIILYDIIIWIIFNSPQSFQVTQGVVPIVLLSLWFLRQGMIKASCITGCIHIIISNILACNYGKDPTIGLCGLLVDLVITFFFAYSKRVLAITLTTYAALFVFHVVKILDTFAVIQDAELSRQIVNLIISGSIAFVLIFASLFVQKIMEVHLWETAYINYGRSDILTKEVLKASEAKDVFVSSLSHEIRNPLNSLKGSIDYLYTSITCPEHLKILENSKLSCEILVNLVSNVLDAAKLRADKMETSYSESCFRGVIKKLLVINSETLRAKDVFTKVFIDKNIPRTLWIDHARLLQIMMNLLSNALKFTPARGKIQINVDWYSSETNIEELLANDDIPFNNDSRGSSPLNISKKISQNLSSELHEFNREEFQKRQENFQLKSFYSKALKDLDSTVHHHSKSEPWTILETISYRDSDSKSNSKGYLKVQLADTGCGIAPEQIPNLFKMFAQAHKSVTTMHGGTGLGLWICRQLCQRMGGDIKLYSEQNRGTSFVFYIPVDTSQNDVLLQSSQIKSQGARNVLIVDDYAHNRELHKLLVEREGARPVLASNGEEAVKKFKAHGEGFFNFVMLDVLMAPLNGFQAAKMIREWEAAEKRSKKVDIYFVSGEYYNEYDLVTAFTENMGGGDTAGIKCLRKPIDIDQLKEVVQKYK